MPEPKEHFIKVERTARYYTLGNEANKTKELWIVLHGYGNLAGQVVEWFEPVAGDAFVVAPEALSRFYTRGGGSPHSIEPVGATWMTREDRLNDIADNTAYLDRLYSNVAKERPERLVVLGFSQGCPAVMRWVAGGSIKPDHVLIWTGDVPRDLHFDAYKAKEASTWLVYSKNDPILPQAMSEESEMLLRTHAILFETIRFDGGHEVQAETLLEVRKRLLEH